MPLKFKNMKGIDFSCASQASTAICSSTDQHFMVKNTTKSFNRLNSYLSDNYKTFTNKINNNDQQYPFSPRAPCISELPFTPRRSFSSSYREKPQKTHTSMVKHSDITPRRKSSADILDVRRRYNDKCIYNYTTFSPPRSNSSRYLLGESRFLDSLPETRQQDTTTQYGSAKLIGYETRRQDTTNQYGSTEVRYETRKQNGTKNSKHDAWVLVPSTPIVTSNEKVHEKKSFGSFLDEEKEKKINKSLVLVNPSDQKVIKSTKYEGTQGSNLGYCNNDTFVLEKSTCATRSREQVVVLRVSLHCRGCEGKLRKHLSKMEGVTSFSIDLETKKVTVIGNVTPLGVLTSISKVKNAQFWPSTVSATPSSSSSSSSTLDFN